MSLTAWPWFRQAESDLVAASILRAEADKSDRINLYCQCIAKYQQAVEKSVKGLLVSAGGRPRMKHDVERYVSILLRMIAAKDAKRELMKLFSQNLRADLRAIDNLFPLSETAGGRRNTEYPFWIKQGWIAPADKGVFSRSEIDRFQQTAHDTFYGCRKIVSAIQRGPRKNLK
ncbi:HEPN domain-containing protein [Candidatus Sumerlaeota bacterium]|nr:HEPN domain-containing protein [Candidatus Sumerlaeota bacterium]